MGYTHTNNENITMDANIIQKSMWIHEGEYQGALMSSSRVLGCIVEKREDVTISFYGEGLLCQDLKN